jgi:hypothetical protein
VLAEAGKDVISEPGGWVRGFPRWPNVEGFLMVGISVRGCWTKGQRHVAWEGRELCLDSLVSVEWID